MSLAHKIHDVFSSVAKGDWQHLVNATAQTLRIRRWINVDSCTFYAVPSFHEAQRTGLPVLPVQETSLQISNERDAAIIPALLECMEGTRDYSWLTPEERAQKFAGFLQHDDSVWVAKEGDKVIGFFWEARNSYLFSRGNAELEWALAPDMAIVEFIFVKASYRGHGVYHQLFAHAYRHSPDMRFACYVADTNEPSIKAQLKDGFKPFGRVIYYVLFGLMFASIRLGDFRKRFFRIRKGVPYKISATT